jgi:peptidoglycan biosynthesis protein MviN/MurJ (putative lipid II flippase)
MVIVAGLRLWTLRGFLSLGVRFSEATLLLKTGLRFHGVTVLLVLAAQANQVLTVANMSNKEIGLYMVALTMAASGFGLVVNSTYDVLFPALSALERTEDQAQLIGRGLRLTTLLLLTVSVSLCILTPWLIPIVWPCISGCCGPSTISPSGLHPRFIASDDSKGHTWVW